MAEDQTNRRLAAILAADVVGYSRLMGANESGTLTALKAHRETVFDPAVARYKGRVVKLIGDGTLAEFASVVDAVNCALAIQRAVKAQTAGSGIVLRIGINLGDIIIDGDDIYGDGVNVAARLEPLAEPGGVCISSIVNESVGNRIAVVFRDGGEVTVKNIARPVRVWKWHPDHDPAAASAPEPAKAAVANGRGGGTAVHRRSALQQHVERPRAGILLRRHHRGHHHRPVQGGRACWSSRAIRASPTRARAPTSAPSAGSLA